MVVGVIQSIEPCDEPGLHIVTKNTIKRIKNVPHRTSLTGSKLTIHLENTVKDYPVVIEKNNGGIGVETSEGASNVVISL